MLPSQEKARPTLPQRNGCLQQIQQCLPPYLSEDDSIQRAAAALASCLPEQLQHSQFGGANLPTPSPPPSSMVFHQEKGTVMAPNGSVYPHVIDDRFG